MDEKGSKDGEVGMIHTASYDTEDPVEFEEKKDLRYVLATTIDAGGRTVTCFELLKGSCMVCTTIVLR